MVKLLKRIIIFSDTHGDIDKCIKILDRIPCDMIIHLGDLVKDAENLKFIYDTIPVEYVRGNNDFTNTPGDKVVEFENIKLFLTHGHYYKRDTLVKLAKDENCMFALFGHTHQSLYEKQDGVYLLNPGSLTRPRGSFPSYGIIEIENNKVSACIIKEDYL